MGTRAIHAPHIAQGIEALTAALRNPGETQLFWQRHWPLPSEPIDLDDACERVRDGHGSRLFAEVPT